MLCLTYPMMLAGYDCDGAWCKDYKIGLGTFMGSESTKIHDAWRYGGYLGYSMRWWNQDYGIYVSGRFGMLYAKMRNADKNMIAYDKSNFGSGGGLVDVYAHFGKNLTQRQGAIFLESILGLQSHIFDSRYGIPSSTLFTLGFGLSGIKDVSNNFDIEYIFLYEYGFYGGYTYPIEYKNDNYGVLKPNNHQIRASISLSHNKGFYTRINIIATYLDAMRKSIDNRYGFSSIYPKSFSSYIMLEFGYSFNQWI